MSRNRVLPGLLIVLLLAGVVLATRILPAPRATADDAPRVLPVATVRPEPASGYVQAREFTGEVRARRESAIGFDLGGRILEVLVADGASVAAKQPLARLDVRRIASEVRGLEARKAEAEAVLAEMRAGPRPEVVQAARQVVAELELQVEMLDRREQRRRALREERTISEEELDDARTELRTTRARLAAARARLGELENGTRAERIDAQVARVEQLEASLQRLRIDVEDAVLVAPYAGRVLDTHVHDGVVVNAGQAVLTLVEDRFLEARIGLPVEVALGLGRGTEHDVRIGSRVFPATLRDTLPTTDVATRTQTAVFDLPDDAREHVVPGQVARLAVEETVAVSGSWLPATALARGTRGLWSVQAVATDAGATEGTVIRHQVEVLHTEGDRVLVRGTLGSDEDVIVGDGERVVPGQRVRSVARTQ